MSTDQNGATVAPLAETNNVKDCLGSGNGQTYSHKWVAAPNSSHWPHQQQCLRCGGIREITGSQK